MFRSLFCLPLCSSDWRAAALGLIHSHPGPQAAGWTPLLNVEEGKDAQTPWVLQVHPEEKGKVKRAYTSPPTLEAELGPGS